MDFKEIRRLNETLRILRQLEELRKTLNQVSDLRRQQEIIRHFMEEKKDQFWRGSKPSEEELETLREKAGYDKTIWGEIVRELLGEQSPEK